ncbi:MAG TPA: hypothetical protein VFR67_07575 [Pilimelia sp.]|nr:hypothetical protein [Pilimelia sp.]
MTSTAPADSPAPAEPADNVGRTEAASEAQAPPRGERWGRLAAVARGPAGRDVGVALLFFTFAAWLTAGLWPDPSVRTLALNPEDQILYEWFLAHDARLFLGDFSLVTDRLNAPDGVNLLANTTVIALGALFAPVTLLFGAETTFAVIAATNLAGTATAWYLLFTRMLGAHRGAAMIGGAFCGFAPGIVSQNNSHLHMTAQWLVPVMVWCVVRLATVADPDNPDVPPGRRTAKLLAYALALAGLVVVQVFVGEEVLFLTAVTLVLMTIGYAAVRPRFVRRTLPRFAAAMLVAVVAAGVVLAYPLWLQFLGPQGVPNGPFSPDYFSADLASWPAISPQSLAGTPEAAQLTTGPAEHNTFLGWPLLLVTIGCVVWLRRSPVVVAAGFAAVVMAALSLGPKVVINRASTDITGPYALLEGLPVVDGALPMRFALAVIPLIALVLVLAVDRALRDPERTIRIALPAAVLIVLLPIVPKPMETAGRAPVPEFIRAGHWRECVEPGGVLVPVPVPTPQKPGAMRWAADANAAFAVPEGFFIGPYGAGGRASMGTYKQPTSQLLADVAEKGELPVITEEHRAQAGRDIAFWGASCVVLADGAPNGPQLRVTLESLLGPGTRVADAWTWKVG